MSTLGLQVVSVLENQWRFLINEVNLWEKKKKNKNYVDISDKITKITQWANGLDSGTSVYIGCVKRGIIQNEDTEWSSLNNLQEKINILREAMEYYRERLYLPCSPLGIYEDRVKAAEIIAHDIYTLIFTKSIYSFKSSSLRSISENRLSEAFIKISNDEKSVISRPLFENPKNYPLSAISLPIDLMANISGFLALHHEIGHDMMTLLGLSLEKQYQFGQSSLKDSLISKGVDPVRACMWGNWVCELLADLFALIISGPAYCQFMISTMSTQTKYLAKNTNSYPSPNLRILFLCEAINWLGDLFEYDKFNQDAERYAKLWKNEIYDKNSPDLEYLPDIRATIETIMDSQIFDAENETKFSLSDLITYTPSEDEKVIKTAKMLIEGNFPDNFLLSPRLMPSTVQYAMEEIFSDQSDYSENSSQSLLQINKLAQENIFLANEKNFFGVADRVKNALRKKIIYKDVETNQLGMNVSREITRQVFDSLDIEEFSKVKELIQQEGKMNLDEILKPAEKMIMIKGIDDLTSDWND